MKSAFSLIELLAAMTILIILIGALTMIYTHLDKVWTQGTGRADCNTAGQAAINMIGHDLEHAVADNILSFAMRADRSSITSYGLTNDEICFVSLEGTNSTAGGINRTALEVQYWVRNTGSGYQLVRGCLTNDIGLSTSSAANCYWNKLWYMDASAGAGRPDSIAAVVAENVAGFSLVAANSTGNIVDDYESAAQGDRLPEYVDVCLELLDEQAANQAAQMTATNVSDFVEQKLRRYTTRVYFQNRSGYRNR